MLILSTSWYELPSKYEKQQYYEWIHILLTRVERFYLVVYCDQESYRRIDRYLDNPRIRAVILPMESFYTYCLRGQWIQNHTKNTILNQRTVWEVNMLWCEKLDMVRRTMRARHFGEDPASWYGWCDIGYFRGGLYNLPPAQVTCWPHPEVIAALDRTKIYYGCVNNDVDYVAQLAAQIRCKNADGVPAVPIPANQTSISGGFFVGTPDNLAWWADTFYGLLTDYFNAGRLIKDDQILVADGVFTHRDRFELVYEDYPDLYNWFMFTRYFLTVPCSILIPLYNGIEYLPESVTSVLEQSWWGPWEIVVGVNGHPPDSEVYQVAKTYASWDARGRIRVYDLAAVGKAAALNAMVPLCSYGWVAVLDVDDVWEPDKLLVQMAYTSMYDVVGTQCVYFGEREGTVPTLPTGDISEFDFTHVNPVVNSSCIVKRAWVERYPWEGEALEDYRMWLTLRYETEEKCRFYNVDRVLVRHRIHAASFFNSRDHSEARNVLVQEFMS